MPRGRRLDGEQPLSNAERQARYRARCRARETPSTLRDRRAVDRRSRPRRWQDAVAELPPCRPNMPHGFTPFPTACRTPAEALQAIIDLDLETLASTEPPRGDGRD